MVAVAFVLLTAAFYLHTHAPASSHDLPHRALDVGGIQILGLRLRNLLELLPGDRPHRLPARRLGSLGEPNGLADQHSGGRRFQDEVESPVDING